MDRGHLNGIKNKNTNAYQKNFHEHVCQDYHQGQEDWSATLTDQCDTEKELSIRECFWQHNIKIFFPDNLNEWEVVYGGFINRRKNIFMVIFIF